MDLARQRMTCWIVAAACVLPATGCATQTQTGALVGTGAGAGVGAIIGRQLGNEGAGALVGAAIGAGTGALIGKKQDDADEQAQAERQAAHAEASQRAQERALTNQDIVDLASAGVSDALIVSSIQDRGGMFDLSPAGLISLKHSGVRDNVVQAMQHYNMAR